MLQTSKRPRITAPGLKLVFEKSWNRKLEDPINCLTVGKPFLEELNEENDILIGSNSGKILIFRCTCSYQEDTVLDTKSGSIQSIVLYDVTGFNAMDLIVGDSDGTVTLFSRRQMLSKRAVGAAITHLEMYEDLVGGFEIISGGVDGIVTSFHPHDSLWRFNIGEESARLHSGTTAIRHSPSIRCLLSVTLPDQDGLSITYILVCDGRPFIHFISKGERVMTLSVPSIINSMCAGNFTGSCTNENEKETYQQVALAGNNGIIYILENYKVTSFVHVDYSITRVLRYRPKSLPESSPDILICAGHCNEIRAYYYGELITRYDTQDWVHDMTLGDIDGDGKDELVMGLLNQTIAVLKCSVDMV